MAIREVLGPSSLDQIVYVVLLWIILVLVVTQLYGTPLTRLEIAVGTGVILIWAVWAVRYRLEQVR